MYSFTYEITIDRFKKYIRINAKTKTEADKIVNDKYKIAQEIRFVQKGIAN